MGPFINYGLQTRQERSGKRCGIGKGNGQLAEKGAFISQTTREERNKERTDGSVSSVFIQKWKDIEEEGGEWRREGSEGTGMRGCESERRSRREGKGKGSKITSGPL